VALATGSPIQRWRSVGPHGALAYTVAHFIGLPDVAASWTDVEYNTSFVLAVKLALCAPAGAVTFASTVTTLESLLKSVTTAPPAGAGALSITVPVEEPPPWTQAGKKDSEKGVDVAGWIVILPPRCLAFLGRRSR
jgi:hypothetical protein